MKNNSVFMRFPGGLSKTLTFSYDDGVVEDVRLVEIFQKHKLRATFNLASGRLLTAEEFNQTPRDYAKRLTAQQAVELYNGDGIEVASHTYSHTHLQTLSAPQVAYEVIKDREQLETLFGKPVRGMAYPYGTYSDTVVEVLRSCGILYSRTVTSTGDFSVPTDLLRLPATCHHNDPRLFELCDRFLKKRHKLNEQPWMFYLWGHSYEFERDDNWGVIEHFAELVSEKKDIWYATNLEIFAYTEAFGRLIFTVNMTSVQNPTATDLWFVLRDKLYCVKAGSSLTLD